MKKKRYRVTAGMTISVSTVVMATSKAKAIEAAEDRAIMSLCHQCAGGDDTEWTTGGELDGTPQELIAEEEDE